MSYNPSPKHHVSPSARQTLSKILSPKANFESTVQHKSARSKSLLPSLSKFTSDSIYQSVIDDSPSEVFSPQPSSNLSSYRNLFRIVNVDKFAENQTQKRSSLIPQKPKAQKVKGFRENLESLKDQSPSSRVKLSRSQLQTKDTLTNFGGSNASPMWTRSSLKSPSIILNNTPIFKTQDEGFDSIKMQLHRPSIEKKRVSIVLSPTCPTSPKSTKISPERRRMSSFGEKKKNDTIAAIFDERVSMILKSPMQSKQPYTTGRIDSMTTLITQEDRVYSPRICSQIKKLQASAVDPFQKEVEYQDSKVPFYLALNTETRQRLFEQVKKPPHERADIDTIIDIKEKGVPEAQSEFINQLSSMERRKKGEDLKSRSPERNTLYKLYALDKKTKERVVSKLQKQLIGTSRFLNA